MKTTLAHRNIFAALVLVPALALAGVVAEPLAGKSGAEAQQQLSRAPNNSPSFNNPTGGPDSDPVRAGRIPRPCPPGVSSVAGANCQPWTPPKYTAISKEDCSCHVTYKTVNGQRIATKDCYVLLPTDEVYYCKNPSVIR